MRVALTLCMLLIASSVAAQTPAVNPCCVHFVPSPDHFAQTYDGTGALVNIVSRYDFNATAMNTLGAIALTQDLGKPDPGVNGTIDLNLSAKFATMTVGAVYTATVAAIGPSGTPGVSAPSNPFVAGGTVPAPRAPTNLTVNKTP